MAYIFALKLQGASGPCKLSGSAPARAFDGKALHQHVGSMIGHYIRPKSLGDTTCIRAERGLHYGDRRCFLHCPLLGTWTVSTPSRRLTFYNTALTVVDWAGYPFVFDSGGAGGGV